MKFFAHILEPNPHFIEFEGMSQEVVEEQLKGRNYAFVTQKQCEAFIAAQDKEKRERGNANRGLEG
jgi:hypothetical protein